MALLAGVPKEICDHFSREIVPHFLVPSELVQCWRNEAQALGWGPAKAMELLSTRREEKSFSERFDLGLREADVAERLRLAPKEVKSEGDGMEHSD